MSAIVKNPTYAQLEAQRTYLERDLINFRSSHAALLAAAKDAAALLTDESGTLDMPCAVDRLLAAIAEAEKLARIAVRAVNSRDALLAAAKDIVHHSYAHGLKSINGTHIAKLDAAIAAAEELAP